MANSNEVKNKKEKLSESGRVGLGVAGIVLLILTAIVDVVGLDIDPELLQALANWIGGIIVTLIAARTVRNRPASA